MTIIGIDPGAGGGIAVKHDGLPTFAIRMPETVADLKDFLDRVLRDAPYLSVLAFIEDVPKFVRVIPGSAIAVLFRNFGRVEGVLTGLGIPYRLVRPQDWQKPLALTTTRSACKTSGQWKNILKAEALRRFPRLKVTLATADALLILNHGQKTPI